MRRIYHYTYCFCFLLGLIQVADAQYGHRTTVYSTAYVQTWRLTEDNDQRRLTQFALPLFISHTISRRFQLFISEANAISTISLPDDTQSPDADSQRLSGIGDTKIKLSYSLIPQKLLLTGGIGLPTGKSRLDSSEAQVFRQLYSETLRFRIGRLGEGRGASIGLAGVHTFGLVTLGFGTSYLDKAAYEPLDIEGAPSYNPGNQYSGVLSVNWDIQRFHVRSGLIFTAYTPDRLEGIEQFRQGAETIVENSVSYRNARLSTTIYSRNTFRQKNALADAGGELVKGDKDQQGHRILLSLTADYRLNRKLTLNGLIENQRRLENEGQGKANVLSIGGGFRRVFTDSLTLEIGARLSQGYMKDDTVDLQGLAISSALISTF